MTAKDKIIDLAAALYDTVNGTLQQATEKIKGQILDYVKQLGKLYAQVENITVDADSLELIGFDSPQSQNENIGEIITLKVGAN